MGSRHPGHRADERGAAAAFVLLLTLVLLVGAGLVVDGGYALAERRRLTSQAEQAARVGAVALRETSLRDGAPVPVVDPGRARAAAAGYLARVGATGATITVDAEHVTVRIEGHAQTVILAAAGLASIPVTGSGSAESIDADSRP
jgi:Flp pilus assembly protein TadG